MLTETKAYILLKGYRSEAPRDIDAMVEAVRRVAVLVSDLPEIEEMAIIPIFAYENGVSTLDIKILIKK